MDLDRRWSEGFDRAKQLNPKPAPVPKPGRPAKLESTEIVEPRQSEFATQGDGFPPLDAPTRR